MVLKAGVCAEGDRLRRARRTLGSSRDVSELARIRPCMRGDMVVEDRESSETTELQASMGAGSSTLSSAASEIARASATDPAQDDAGGGGAHRGVPAWVVAVSVVAESGFSDWHKAGGLQPLAVERFLSCTREEHEPEEDAVGTSAEDVKAARADVIMDVFDKK